jgi:hypothetical protein
VVYEGIVQGKPAYRQEEPFEGSVKKTGIPSKGVFEVSSKEYRGLAKGTSHLLGREIYSL